MIAETRELYEQHRGKFSFLEKRRNRIPYPRGLAEDHPLLVAARDQKLLYDEGRIVYACVVDAHKSIYEKGNDVCEATVVFSEDEVFDEFPNLLAEVAIRVARLQDANQADLPEEHKAVLRELTGRSSRRQNMLLPKDLSYQKDAYMTTVYIYRPHLPRPLLLRGFFPMLVLPEKTTASIILPAAYWSEEMRTEWLSEY